MVDLSEEPSEAAPRREGTDELAGLACEEGVESRLAVGRVGLKVRPISLGVLPDLLVDDFE